MDTWSFPKEQGELIGLEIKPPCRHALNLHLLGETSSPGLFRASLEPSHGRKAANWRSEMRLNQALPALPDWESQKC